MRAALLLAFVAAGIAVASAALTCMGDKEKCKEDECCIKFGAFGRCKKLQEEDKLCEVNPRKVLLKDHVYLRACPCRSGLKCVAKDGIAGKVLGTCQEDSSEEPEPEPEPDVDPEPEPEPQPDPEPEDPEEPEPEEE